MFITKTSSSHQFFQRLHRTDNFWQQALLEQLLFLKELSILWNGLFVSLTERGQSSILWEIMHLFYGRFCDHPLIFSAVVGLFGTAPFSKSDLFEIANVFFYQCFLLRTLGIHRTVQERRGTSLHRSTTFSCSRTFMHLLATLLAR